ncbi:MAG: 50S ribosomal protein L19 [Verrucomicrobiota bacterium]
MKLLEKIENEQLKKRADFEIGDTVKVYIRVKEGEKERAQIFSGIVIGKKGRGLNAQFTVRRISHGEGVEKVFPVHAPSIEKIVVEARGKTRRAKLYYLRNIKGAMNVKASEEKEEAKAS